MNLVQLAGALPRDPEFREWCGGGLTTEQAAELIRFTCGITSRRELATDTEAQQRFHRFLRKPFLAWREQQHQPA